MQQARKKQKKDESAAVEPNQIPIYLSFTLDEYQKYNPINPSLEFFASLVNEYMEYCLVEFSREKRGAWRHKHSRWEGNSLVSTAPTVLKLSHEHIEFVKHLAKNYAVEKGYKVIVDDLQSFQVNPFVLKNGNAPALGDRLRQFKDHEQRKQYRIKTRDDYLEFWKQVQGDLTATPFYQKTLLAFLKIVFVWKSHGRKHAFPDDVTKYIITLSFP